MSEPIIVSFSELDAFRQCPLKHALGYKQRWKPETASDALALGTVWHQVLETHYGIIKDAWDAKVLPFEGMDDNILEAARIAIRDAEYLKTADGKYTQYGELVEWMYQGYVEKYGVDADWRPLAIEYPFQIPLLDARGRATRYHIKGKIDVVMRSMNTGLLWVWDHKSGADLPNRFDLEIDDQFGVYTWAMRQLGKSVQGSMHNATRKRRNQADFPDYAGKSKPQTLDQRNGRTYLNRSDEELTALALDAYNAARAAHPPKSKELPLYSSPNPGQCGWKCDFKEVHLAARGGTPIKEALLDRGFIQDFTRH